MTRPETRSFISDQAYINYLDGLKDNRGRVRDFHFIVSLKTSTTSEKFLENLTDAAATEISHATHPNRYEEGNYRSGILHPKLYGELEWYFRRKELLEDHQTLTPFCYYSSQPTEKRANLVIEVIGKKGHDWRQFILCWLENNFSQFELRGDIQTINSMKKLAQT